MPIQSLLFGGPAILYLVIDESLFDSIQVFAIGNTPAYRTYVIASVLIDPDAVMPVIHLKKACGGIVSINNLRAEYTGSKILPSGYITDANFYITEFGDSGPERSPRSR